jgi:hypothetical protein
LAKCSGRCYKSHDMPHIKQDRIQRKKRTTAFQN